MGQRVRARCPMPTFRKEVSPMNEMYTGKFWNKDFAKVILPFLYENGSNPAVQDCLHQCNNAFSTGMGIIPAMNRAYTIYEALN